MQAREELWPTWIDKPVEIDQRGLVDKVLARYSGEFTLFRELLQNSDDARAKVAEIHFETAAYLDRKERRENQSGALPDLKSTTVTQWTYRNNGPPFTPQDWKRLPRIAAGNPDPRKIGAFGVGFYCLFSITDRPFVSSGGSGMQFYWKDEEDKLYVRHGKLPARESSDPWTTFEIPLREAGSVPPALDLIRFLASSITFMLNLREIGVFVDEHCIGRIKKKLKGAVENVGIPAELKRSSPLCVMNVEKIQCHLMTIEAEVDHTIYSMWTGKLPQGVTESNDEGDVSSSQSPPQPNSETVVQHKTSVDLTLFTAVVKVELSEKLTAELLRSTKKQPPKRLTYGLVYTGKHEYDQSFVDQRDLPSMCDPVFQGLRADLNGATHTRIFIGHATAQTTGMGGHMASYFISTVERESIDFIDRNIAIWNEELLYVGGLLSRAVYELELSKIQDAWNGMPGFDGTPDFRPPPDLQDALHQQFLHILKFFTFHRSTPSEKVAQMLQKAFYSCSTVPLRLLSSAGVRSASEMKKCDIALTRFLKYLPTLPQYVVKECLRFIEALPDQHKISPITLLDVLQDLQKHALTQEELIACLQWWRKSKDDLARDTAQLQNTITFDCANGTVLPLSSVKYFLDLESHGAYAPLDGPLPTSLISLDITKKFTPADLRSFGWQEFTIADWLDHISQPEIMSANPEYDITRSIPWAERVLSIVSGVWTLPSEALRPVARSTFRGKECIPTDTHGLLSLCLPEKSFLPSTNPNLFRDLGLPIVRIPRATRGDMEGFLSYIGVRRRIPPELLLDGMVKAGNWSISALIGYFVQVQNTLTLDEFSKLESLEAFTAEGAQGDNDKKRALDLYPPLDEFRRLQLPVIDWDGRSGWRNDSDEAELLYRLGLRRYPSLQMIVHLSSTVEDTTVRTAAFRYLCDNLRSKYSHYHPNNFRDTAFIPAENVEGPFLAKMGDVFLSTRWKGLGFPVVQDLVRKDPVTELGVRQHPSASTLFRILESTPPADDEKARQWFEALLECIPSFLQPDLTRLSKLPIVPTRSQSPNDRKHLAPAQCYLAGVAKDEFHQRLFVFVNFGSTANRFLAACGAKNEPSVTDIVESLVEDPKRFYDLAGGQRGFLAELKSLAPRIRYIPNPTLSEMKSKPILLGVRRKKTIEGEDWEYEPELREPGEIFIADDVDSYQLFGDAIFVVPQDGPEDLYVSLGCPRLSHAVQKKYKASKEMEDTKVSSEVQSLILERLPLFLRENASAQIRVPSSHENFKVKVYRNLIVSKTLTIGRSEVTRIQDAWAAAEYDDEGQIELWLSGNAEPDMYEIATSLCQLLFGRAKTNDTLLLATILSTPLEILKRRGYNVGKIPQHHDQQPDKLMEVKNDGRSAPQATAALSPANQASEEPAMTTDPGTVVTSFGPSANPLAPGDTSAPAPSGNIPSVALPHQSGDHTSDQARGGPIQNFRRRFMPRARHSEVTESALSPQHLWTSHQAIPQSYIRANVSKAIKACNPEGGKLLHHRNKVEKIREFPSEGYCDVSGQVGKLECRGKQGDVKVFTGQDDPDAGTFMTNKHDELVRFVSILTPVAKLYDLELPLLHVFYDATGGPIAFNRNGRIFLNLRYFEAWHYQDVRTGSSRQAQVSWFFVVAHELAHNLIKEHNSEHEFWFSAICEVHVFALSRLLANLVEDTERSG